jgi:hypothetical protein
MSDFFLTVYKYNPIIKVCKQWIISLIVGCPIFTLISYFTIDRDEQNKEKHYKLFL